MPETMRDAGRMVTHRFTLDQAKQAYETFDTGRTGKVVIVDET